MVPPVNVRNHALKLHVKVARAAHFAPLEPEVELPLPGTVQDGVLGGLAELFKRHVKRNAKLLTGLPQHRRVVLRRCRVPRNHRARFNRQALVRNNQVGINFNLVTQPVTRRTSPVRRVKRKQPRLEFADRKPAVRAGKILGKLQRFATNHVNRHEPVGQLEGRLHRIKEPRANPLFHDNPVNNHRNGVLLVLLQFRHLVQVVAFAVNHHPDKPGPANFRQHLLVLALLIPDHRRQQLQLGPLRQLQDAFDHLLGRLARNYVPIVWANRCADPRPQQPQVVVNFRYRPDR